MYGEKIRTQLHSSVILALNSFFVCISKYAVSQENSKFCISVFIARAFLMTTTNFGSVFILQKSKAVCVLPTLLLTLNQSFSTSSVVL